MTGETKFGMGCSEFELLLSDALDGALGSADMQRFHAHAAACPACGPLLAHAEAGKNWLETLDEVEPPRNLVRNILAVTTRRAPAAETVRQGLGERLRGWADSFVPKFRAGWTPVYATLRQPRFMMSCAMVVFTFALTLNIFNIKLSSLARLDLRPTSIREAVSNSYYQTSARVVRYYDNLRLVMEMRTRMQDLQPDQSAPQPQQQNKDRDTTEQPDRDRNYSEDSSAGALANVIPAAQLLNRR